MRGSVRPPWDVAGARLRTACGWRFETGIPVVLRCRAIGLLRQSRFFDGHSWRVELRTFTLVLLLSLRGVNHSWLVLQEERAGGRGVWYDMWCDDGEVDKIVGRGFN